MAVENGTTLLTAVQSNTQNNHGSEHLQKNFPYYYRTSSAFEYLPTKKYCKSQHEQQQRIR